MKKIIILLICLTIITGCKKNNNQNNTDTPSNTNIEEVIYYTEEDAKARLNEIAEDLYENQKYLSYTKKDGKYFISLKELRDNLKYDTKKIDYLEGLKCDENETGVAIDVDNLSNTYYYGNPVIVYTLCNPPSSESE